MSKMNRSESIKNNVFRLFLLIFTVFALLSLMLAAAAFMARPDLSLALIIIPCTLSLLSITILIFSKLYRVLKQLDDFAILDSNEINVIIAKNTAPFRRKYYNQLNINKEKTEKITLLRSDLNKLYIKLKDNNRSI